MNNLSAKSILYISFVTLIVLLSAFAISAAYAATPPVVLCLKDADGTITLRNNKCKKGETKLTNFAQLKGDKGDTGATGSTGATGPSGILAAFKVSSTGSLVSKTLSSSVTAVTASFLGSGIYQVDLTGTFAGLSATDSAANKEKIIVNPSIGVGNDAVTDYQIVSATSTSLRLWIYAFKSDNGTALQNELSVTVFLGS